MKALVSISISREWNETEFLMQMGTWKIPSNWQVRFGWFRQFTAAERHNVALGEGCYNYDRVLFMDTDQVYPPEYLEMMLAHNEPIVTGLNVSRYYPFEFTTYRFDGEENKDGVTVPRFKEMRPPDDQKSYECDCTGTGALMVDPDILNAIPKPYFKDIYDNEGCVRYLCDDFYFCWLLYKAGIKIVVDQNIVAKHIIKMLASPYNTKDLRRAWEMVNSGFGICKDGRKA